MELADGLARHSFQEIVDELLEGRKVRRKEWPTDGTYITMRNDILVVYRPKEKVFSPLMVSTGDLLGEDWVVVTEIL